MVLSFSSKLLLRRLLRPKALSRLSLLEASIFSTISHNNYTLPPLSSPNIFTRPFFTSIPCYAEESQGPAAVDYRSIMPEQEFHQLADETIHNLLEKLEEFGDSLQLDGFDIDYGNQVLTLNLGSLGTYVINKQTPNRQIWLSSPVSGPARFDWDVNANAWIYTRTKANLFQLLQKELQELLGEPVNLS